MCFKRDVNLKTLPSTHDASAGWADSSCKKSATVHRRSCAQLHCHGVMSPIEASIRHLHAKASL